MKHGVTEIERVKEAKGEVLMGEKRVKVGAVEAVWPHIAQRSARC